MVPTTSPPSGPRRRSCHSLLVWAHAADVRLGLSRRGGGSWGDGVVWDRASNENAEAGAEMGNVDADMTEDPATLLLLATKDMTAWHYHNKSWLNRHSRNAVPH